MLFLQFLQNHVTLVRIAISSILKDAEVPREESAAVDIENFLRSVLVLRLKRLFARCLALLAEVTGAIVVAFLDGDSFAVGLIIDEVVFRELRQRSVPRSCQSRRSFI